MKNNINSGNNIYNNKSNKMGLKTKSSKNSGILRILGILRSLGIFGILLVLMLGVSGSFAQSNSSYDTELIRDIESYYTMDSDDINNTVLKDVVKQNQVNGTLTGTVINSSGVINQGLYLDGQGSTIDVTGLDLLNNYTVSGWYNWSGEELDNTAQIVSSKNDNLFSIAVGGQYDISVYDGSNWRIQEPQISNEWVHIAFTYDGTRGRLYLNGDLAGSYTGDFKNIDGQIKLGSRYDSENKQKFKGQLDEFVFYNDVKSEDTINELYSRQLNNYTGSQYDFKSVSELNGTVNTVDATGITHNKATLRGNFTNPDTLEVETGYYFREQGTSEWEFIPTINSSLAECVECDYVVEELSPETTYEFKYRGYFKEPYNEELNGTVKQFTTREEPTGSISFYLFSKNDDEPIQRSDLYLSTPCPDNTLGWTTQEHQRNKPLYIQKVDENGVSAFENLETNQTFNFCLLRGDITGVKDDYTTNYELKSIKKNTFLGEFENSYNESVTNSYTLYLEESDIFSFFTPQYWGFSIQQFFFIVSSFVLGGLILSYGILSGTSAGVITGGIFMMLGLTLTMLLYLFGGVL